MIGIKKKKIRKRVSNRFKKIITLGYRKIKILLLRNSIATGN